MNKREWITQIVNGNRDLPVPQHWMSFFNGKTAKRLSPENCDYDKMWLFDVGTKYDFSPIENEELDKMINFNNYHGRCFTCLGRGANIAFGHGGPGEFFLRLIEKTDQYIIGEYETGVKAKVNLDPHFYHHFDFPVKTIDDLKKLNLPDPEDPARYEGLAHDAAYLKSKGQYVVASLNGFFSGLHYFFSDYATILMACAADQDFINASLDLLGNWNLKAAQKMIEAGVDCIMLCDDLGSKHSLLMSPNNYRDLFKPWHKKLCDLAHKSSVQVHFHSHGSITPLLDDIADCGFDFVNPFDPEEDFDIQKLLDDYSDKFIIVGGMPAAFWEKPQQEQDKILTDLITMGKKSGRFILMDSGGIPENVTNENYEHIINLSRKLRGVEGVEGLN